MFEVTSDTVYAGLALLSQTGRDIFERARPEGLAHGRAHWTIGQGVGTKRSAARVVQGGERAGIKREQVANAGFSAVEQ